MLVETTAAGWGDGKTAAPQHDWLPKRLGSGIHRGPGACLPPTASPALWPLAVFRHPCSWTPTGTAQREAVRRWHLGTVIPLAKLVERELSDKLEVPTLPTLRQPIPSIWPGAPKAFQKLVAGGMAIPEAVAVCGLLVDDGSSN